MALIFKLIPLEARDDGLRKSLEKFLNVMSSRTSGENSLSLLEELLVERLSGCPVLIVAYKDDLKTSEVIAVFSLGEADLHELFIFDPTSIFKELVEEKMRAMSQLSEQVSL